MYVLFTRYGHIEHPYESCSMTVQCRLLCWDEPNQYLPYLSLFTAVFFHCIVPFKYVLSIHLLAIHYSAVPVVVGWNHCVVRCCVIFLVFLPLLPILWATGGCEALFSSCAYRRAWRSHSPSGLLSTSGFSLLYCLSLLFNTCSASYMWVNVMNVKPAQESAYTVWCDWHISGLRGSSSEPAGKLLCLISDCLA